MTDLTTGRRERRQVRGEREQSRALNAYPYTKPLTGADNTVYWNGRLISAEAGHRDVPDIIPEKPHTSPKLWPMPSPIPPRKEGPAPLNPGQAVEGGKLLASLPSGAHRNEKAPERRNPAEHDQNMGRPEPRSFPELRLPQ